MSTHRHSDPGQPVAARQTAPKSLRLRLVVALSLTLCLLWGSVAAWMFPTLQRELRLVLDNRLIASAKMVAGLAHQFQQQQDTLLGAQHTALQSVIGRDGVACEVSLVRSEVDIVPLARTDNSPGFSPAPSGFGQIEKGGKLWRTYVLEDHGIRIATADRLDVRDQLVTAFARTLVLPFVLSLVGVVALSWWITGWCLQPLRQLGQMLAQRPPQDPSPLQIGLDTVELAPLTRNLNQLLARMDAALEHERRWTADAAHELRTPLTAIKTHTQIAQLVLERQAAADCTQARQALAQAHAGIEHMHATLEQLLQLAQLENTCNSTAPASCASGAHIVAALRRAINQSLERARRLAAQGQQPVPQLHTAVDATLESAEAWQLHLPPALLTCAITNLLDNALRHHRGPLPVTVRMQLHSASTPGAPGSLVVSVEDHGAGLNTEERSQALQRFWRKAANSAGSGLGLTIVQRIAHSAGGRLQLQAHADGTPGLCAQLHLPAQPPTAPPREPAVAPALSHG